MTVRIGMIGAGRMAHQHAECLAEIPEARIVAVADTAPGQARALAERWGAAVYSDYSAMLDHGKLDAVYICTPTGTHPQTAVAAAERGLPFFVEKPLALTMEDAWRITRAVEQARVMSCVCYHWRYTNAVIKAQEILAGRALALTAAQWWWTLPPIMWLRDKDLGGGQVVDQTTHLTDLCQLFGGAVSKVYAAYSQNTYTLAELNNWDGYSLSFKHTGGAVGSLRCTYALFKEIADYEPPRVDLIAREMFLRITPTELTVVTPQDRQEYRNEGAHHFGVNRAFVLAVASKDASYIRSSVPETLRSLALTLAANESARSDKPVDLDAFMDKASLELSRT
ncbi:MAG: Gfo/Idh/MocA family oxidoreductase [Anaerolineales bacterium]|nr:Gfo/Idh/MocA family oxidoreductase [Anaerolineales bacterium]